MAPKCFINLTEEGQIFVQALSGTFFSYFVCVGAMPSVIALGSKPPPFTLIAQVGLNRRAGVRDTESIFVCLVFISLVIV